MGISNLIFLMTLAFLQNVCFSLVSRSRNRDNFKYHAFASVLSNAVWFLTFRYLVVNNMQFSMFIPYTLGTVLGSTFGTKISMSIEKFLNAKSDSHLN